MCCCAVDCLHIRSINRFVLLILDSNVCSCVCETAVDTEEVVLKIKHASTKEYLYAAVDELAHDVDRRRIFTWRYPDEDAGPQGQWTFQAEEDHFLIMNRRFGEHLFAAADDWTLEGDRRSVFTWRSMDQDPNDENWEREGYWEMGLIYKPDTEAITYWLRNEAYDEYLCASSDDLAFDSERRNVHTSKTYVEGECDWILE